MVNIFSRTAGTLAAASVISLFTITGPSAAASPLAQVAPADGISSISATSDCVPNAFCIWGDSNYTGRWFLSGYSTPNVGPFINDHMTSYWNRTSKYVCVYEAIDYQYPMVVEGIAKIPPGHYSPNVNPFANDKLSSFKLLNSMSEPCR
ncbi:peptidase inhibitor family I36 protein [Streptomyces sp. NPDC057806]|uniref:peptidase inhibitor family I36 protein n=1 Tax=Streptomyces sp. NPDC057806 TaxID=3346255 RepID=UPI0036B6489B